MVKFSRNFLINWWKKRKPNENPSFIPENKFILDMAFLWAGGSPPTWTDHFLTAISIIVPFFLIIPVHLHAMYYPGSREELTDIGFQIMYFYIISIRQLLWVYYRADLRILLNLLQADWDKRNEFEDSDSILSIKKSQSLCRRLSLGYIFSMGLLNVSYPMLPINQYIYFAATNSFPSNYSMQFPYRVVYDSLLKFFIWS